MNEGQEMFIDIIDSRTQKVLWRNHVTRPILRNPSAKLRQARIQEAVNDVLQGVRVEH